ncbi:MAG: sodium:proton antiporter [Firmicutes bacterium]|nr:sodium:proton antiporter [Bacillota bacterium]
MEIPLLISDLAVMMLTAGIITILFRRIKQPLVLGYILAGFLMSPYFPLFMTVEDMGSIHTWSEIGIIFLMFHLGLEFNLHKLAQVGSTAIVTTIIEVAGVLAVGFAVGMALGFTVMDSVCLGGMLSMSSTTVIIKVFDEMNLKGKKYTEMVFGTLVVQDIVGIFMMVILSTISVPQNISGGEVALSLALMLLYLIIWLLLGIYLIPTFFNRTVRLMNDEMMLVVSIGLCFGMVLLASWLGFSTALGAFLAGSLLAGTLHAERVEHLTKGVKDMFGAVFFLSVGMMVDPEMIVKYAVPIAVITVVTIVGKLIFSALGMLLSGQTLENSISSGFALAQIGEFAFIIASLGTSLGITGEYLYPIVVAVSVITTFTTPFCIKAAPYAVDWLQGCLPEKLLVKLNRYTSPSQQDKEQDSEWYIYIKRYFFRVVVYGGIMLAAAILGIRIVEPFLSAHIPDVSSEILTCLLTYIIMAIFIRPMLNLHNNLFTSLWLKQMSFRLPLLVLNAIKIGLIAVIAMIPLRVFFNVHLAWLAVILIVVLGLLSKTGFMATWYLQLETRFLKNFNERIIRKEEKAGHHQDWLDRQLFIISFIAPYDGDYLEKSLEELNWGARYNIYVVKIRHNGKHHLLPNSKMVIHEGDKVFLVGAEKALLNFYALTGLVQTKPLRTLKQFMDSDYPDIENALSVIAIKLRGDETFTGKSIRQGNFRDKWKSLILGLQRDGYPISMPDPNLLLKKDDILWIMGSNNSVGLLAAEYVDETAD